METHPALLWALPLQWNMGTLLIQGSGKSTWKKTCFCCQWDKKNQTKPNPKQKQTNPNQPTNHPTLTTTTPNKLKNEQNLHKPRTHTRAYTDNGNTVWNVLWGGKLQEDRIPIDVVGAPVLRIIGILSNRNIQHEKNIKRVFVALWEKNTSSTGRKGGDG